MKLVQALKRHVLALLPPMIVFFIAFTLILVTKRLILSEYGISWSGFGSAFIGAYLIGKVVLMVDKLPISRKSSDRRLIYIASWKCLIYFLAAGLFQYLERVVPLVLKHGSLPEAQRLLLQGTVWPHVWLVQMWLAVLFFIYCVTRELVRAIGRERVLRLLF